MLITKDIIVPKHIRFFQSKEIEDQDEVWILFHGYAENINDFYNSFKPFTNKNRCFILPQGPSKFYQKGVKGKIGASWMTSDNRLKEIENLNLYLNKLAERLQLENKTLNVFAFSQGVATASRWICQSKLTFDEIIFWGSPSPNEVDEQIYKFNPQYFFGDKDQFLVQIKEKTKIPQSNLNSYPEGHIVSSELLGKHVFKKSQ